MSNKSILVSLIAALAALTLPESAQAQQGARANLAGTYRCEPEPSPCPWPGQMMAIAQTGTTLALRNDQGEFADAKVTSDITLSGGPPWNALGVVLPDHSIQWSNGTKWRKQ